MLNDIAEVSNLLPDGNICASERRRYFSTILPRRALTTIPTRRSPRMAMLMRYLGKCLESFVAEAAAKKTEAAAKKTEAAAKAALAAASEEERGDEAVEPELVDVPDHAHLHCHADSCEDIERREDAHDAGSMDENENADEQEHPQQHEGAEQPWDDLDDTCDDMGEMSAPMVFMSLAEMDDYSDAVRATETNDPVAHNVDDGSELGVGPGDDSDASLPGAAMPDRTGKLYLVRLRSSASTLHIEHYFVALPSQKASFADGAVLTYNTLTNVVYCCGKHPVHFSGGIGRHPWNLKNGGNPTCSFLHLFKNRHDRSELPRLGPDSDGAIVTHLGKYVTYVEKQGCSVALLRATGGQLKCYTCLRPACSHIHDCNSFRPAPSAAAMSAAERPPLVDFDVDTRRYFVPQAAQFASHYTPQLRLSDPDKVSMLTRDEWLKRLAVASTGIPIRPFPELSITLCPNCTLEPKICWLTVGCLHAHFMALLELPLCDHCMQPLVVRGESCDSLADLFIGKPHIVQYADGQRYVAWALDVAVTRMFLRDKGRKSLRRVFEDHGSWSELQAHKLGTLQPPT